MADILLFPDKKKKRAAKPTKPEVAAGKGNTLCKSGFHKWRVDKNTSFTVREGKLQTRHLCERCGKVRVEYT